MALKNRINELTEEEKIDLKNLIDDFIQEFTSKGQSKTANDFEDLLNSKKITLRIVCKLSEWCNTDSISRRKGKEQAIKISKILLGGVVPKLDDRQILIGNGKIELNL